MPTATPIFSPNAPAAIGPYSQAFAAGDFLYVSGQLPVRPGDTDLMDGGIALQTEQVLMNLRAILAEVDLSLDSTVKTTVFLTDLSDFTVMNEVYERHFASTSPPARSTVQVAALPKGAAVEIELVAYSGAPAAIGA